MDSDVNLAQLHREADALALAQSAITRCCLALGDEMTNHIQAILSTKLREVTWAIDVSEGRIDHV